MCSSRAGDHLLVQLGLGCRSAKGLASMSVDVSRFRVEGVGLFVFKDLAFGASWFSLQGQLCMMRGLGAMASFHFVCNGFNQKPYASPDLRARISTTRLRLRTIMGGSASVCTTKASCMRLLIGVCAGLDDGVFAHGNRSHPPMRWGFVPRQKGCSGLRLQEFG